MEKQFVVLYTHQKQKKAKTWHDGSLKHTGSGTKFGHDIEIIGTSDLGVICLLCREKNTTTCPLMSGCAVLYDEKGCRLDSIHIKLDDIKLGEQLESDRYYILVEDVKVDDTKNAATDNSCQSENIKTQLPSQAIHSRARCAGLKRKKSGFMPPRMIKQTCLENSQNLQSEIDRYSGFPISSPQHINKGDEAGRRVPLLPQETQTVQDTHAPLGRKSLEADIPFQKYENMERNLFNLYSRYNRQDNSLESETSSQESSTNGESRKVPSPWSVYGSKNSSPSSNRTINRQEQVSESPQSGLHLSLSIDRKIGDTNTDRFVANVENLHKSVHTETVKLGKSHLSQLEATNSRNGVKSEMSPSSSKNLPGPRKSDKTFNETTKQSSDENRRNITQIIKLLRKKPTLDCALQDNLKDRPSNNEKCFKPPSEDSSINKTNVGEVNISTKESVYVGKIMPRPIVTCVAETLLEKESKSGLIKAETVAEEEEKSSTNLSASLKKPNCGNDTTVKLDSEEDILKPSSAKEESDLLEECEESYTDEDILGSFHINFSPLSHVTDSDDEKQIDISSGKGNTADVEKRNINHNAKCNEETSKFYSDDEKIGSESKDFSGSIHSQNLITYKVETIKTFASENAKENTCELNILRKLNSQQESTDCYPAVMVEKQTCGEQSLQTNIDVLHDIDREFADNIRENSSHTGTCCDTALKSFEEPFEYNNKDHYISVLKRNNVLNCAVDTVGQQKCDEKSDCVKETDDVEADICNIELKVQDICDEKVQANALHLNGKELEGVELDDSMGTTEDAIEKLVDSNGSQSSRTTTISQDTLDFSCNTLDDDRQNYFGIPTRQLDSLVQSNSRSSNGKNKTDARNSPDEKCGSKYFEHNITTSCKNNSTSQNVANRGGLYDLEDSEIEDPVGHLDVNLRTIQSHPNEMLQKQIRGKVPQRLVKSKLGSYGTQGLSSAVVSRVYHSVREDRKVSGPYRNTTERPLIASSLALDGVVYQQQSPFQQLSGSEVSEQSSPSFFIDWPNDKPQIQRAEKLCEDEASSVFGPDHDIGNLHSKFSMERAYTQNIDEEDIYNKLYRPRLMYQQDNLRAEYDCTDHEYSGICKTGENESPASLSERQIIDRCIDIEKEKHNIAKHGSIENSQDSLAYPGTRTLQNLFRDDGIDERKVYLTDSNLSNFDSQSSEQYFLDGETRSAVSPLQFAVGRAESFMAEDTLNQTPDLDSAKRLKNSRWQSFMASQASDDCDIDISKLAKMVDITDKSKKGFVVLENSPGLYNTQRVVHQNNNNKSVPSSFIQSFTDGLGSQQEDSWSDNDTFNEDANEDYSKHSNSLERTSTENIQDADIEIQGVPEKEITFVDQKSDDKVAVNVTLNERPMSYLIPDTRTLSITNSFEQLIAEDYIDVEVIQQNAQIKSSVSGGPEQQVPELEVCNSGESKMEEYTDDAVRMKSRNILGTCNNLSQDLSRDCSATSLKEIANIETSLGIKFDKCKKEKIDGKHEADDYDFENAVVQDGIKDIVDLDNNASNAESVFELKRLEQNDSSQEKGLTEDAVCLEDIDKFYQEDCTPVSIAPKILNSKEKDERKISDKCKDLTMHKKPFIVQNGNAFSLDDSLDLSLDNNIADVSLAGSDQLCKKPHSLRIGWQPPVKTGIQVSNGQSSNDIGNKSQQKDVDSSGKLKPTFKCLRLLTQSKTRVNSENYVNTCEIDEKGVATLPIYTDSVTDKDNQQKWKFKSPKQSPNLSLSGKNQVSAGANKPILDMGKNIEVMKFKETDYHQKRLQDGQASKTVPNRRFKPPSLTRTPVLNSTVSSPSFTQRFSAGTVVATKKGACVSQTELRFPSKSEVEGMQNVLRHVVILETFPSATVYKQVLMAALTEYVNTQLFDVAKRFHHALSTVDTSGYSEYKSRNSRSSVNNPNPPCQCGIPSKMICVKKDGPNCGRYFYACSADRNQQCKFFQWADEMRRGSVTSGNRRKIQDVHSLNMYMKDHRVHFYGECKLMKRTKENINKYFKAPKWARNRGEADMLQKKQILLKLPYKGRSSLYAKDDIWVISKHIDFDPRQTFLARSTYYGPSSSQEVEIEPLTGYSPSNWKNEEVCHAVLAGNVSSELSCIDNVREHINTQSPPVLPHLINRQNEDTGRLSNCSKGFQAPRVLAGDQSSRNIHIHSEQMDELSRQYIEKYSLNLDQAEAVKRVANMFSIEKSSKVDSILLIHGVFGAGKSYLLSVMVLFLVEVFKLNDSQSPDQPFPWKLLISSTTNVAVDRILIGLLELGFEDFVRVGSVKKIAKPVLPFSVHASGTDNQELKDLQEMLRSGELTATEKSQVRQSIEKHRHGENKKKLGRVRVVGATCASCSLTCLNNMEFPLCLLDECSQMTEPASLLPIAKFGCQKLLLVGDPKQLDPTIQGTEAAHQNGLEQTMFDRLIKMGSMPTLLRTQYRCHPYISAVANKLFYGGMLEDGVSECDRKPLLEILPTICYYDVERGEECCEGVGSYYNEREAQFVVFLLQVLLTSGIHSSAIGVITLYKSQMARISDLLTGQGDCMDLKGIQVSTVDAFQGGERDVIILSTVRSQACGFIDNDKRTNVALTRAKHHLLIVGNLNNLSKNVLWAKVIHHCKCYENGVQSADEARHSLEKYLDGLANCEPSGASENSNTVKSQNSTASEKLVGKRKPKRKRKLSGSETNNDINQGNAHLRNENDYSVERSTKSTKKCSSVDLMDELLDDNDFDTEMTADMLETDIAEARLESSEGWRVNSKSVSSSGTLDEDHLSAETIDNFHSNFQQRKRPRHVTQLSSLVFDSDLENTEEDDLPVFNCD